MQDFAAARARMVERQIAARGLTDARLLDAFRAVPREEFVPDHLREFAYEDVPLPIEARQTISQPYIVALMLDAAGIAPGDRLLEVGTGSGYAAAVASGLAVEVIGIERHPELTDLAADRLTRLGFANVSVHTGDGTHGWPESAPFDVILVAASGPSVPDELTDQLVVGGRLVMPVGEPDEVQKLVKVVRTGKDEFEHEDLVPVRFVPLIGTHGWQSEKGGRARPRPLPDLMREAAEPLPDLDDPTFAAFVDRFAEARVVMLGEASHGTSEFYRARAAISRRLIERHGFDIVAVEADWPDAATVDRYVRHRERPAEDEPAFRRFPTWMWRNTDVDAFTRWLRGHNRDRAPPDMAGFYGLDLYNLNGSIRAVIDYLDDVDPGAATVARERYGCLMPWSRDPAAYGRMALTEGHAQCEQPVIEILRELLAKRLEYGGGREDREDFLDAAQNARLVRDAEAYYRAMYQGPAESWNLRDTHMFETLCHLLDARGPQSKAIVWAHNSHIGDATHTEMGQVREELNIGQLCRERFRDEAVLIGLGTHSGTVAAATDWDGPMEVKTVRPSLAGSYEQVSHDVGLDSFLLDLREGQHEELRHSLWEPRLERFIGVIYRPESERWSHYIESSLPGQFDAWLWFDETHAVIPLDADSGSGEDDTYPFGL
jgi:protein-L-isoaspartate(D-aspartate) O-methyltransferase